MAKKNDKKKVKELERRMREMEKAVERVDKQSSAAASIVSKMAKNATDLQA